MVFNSMHFLIFFPIALAGYYIFQPKKRWFFLLLVSIYFYVSYLPKYALVLFALITLDYFAGRLIERYIGSKRAAVLILSLVGNLSVLCFFKYINLMTSWNILLPLGLSFHVFQSLSYVIEVYRGNYRVEKHFGMYALYVMFFPQLVAGPIERPGYLLPQLKLEHKYNWPQILSGVEQMIWGFFKKLVIADRIAQFVDPTFLQPDKSMSINVILAIFLFTLQLYADFSGYVDIAIGSARTLGIELSPNFNHPFHARTVADFWRRWHISLSSWFRDYVYIPLGGSRVSSIKWARNILITFLITGIWHGAGWNFAIMGLISAIYIIAGKYIQPFGPPIWQRMQTFILMSFCWLFFRASTLTDATMLLRQLFAWHDITWLKILYGHSMTEFLIMIIGIYVMLFVERFDILNHKIIKSHAISKTALTAFLLLSILAYGVYSGNQFIYFQF